MNKSEQEKINSMSSEEVQRRLLMVQINTFSKLSSIVTILTIWIVLFILGAIMMLVR